MVRFGAQLAAISASSGEARRSQLVHLDYTRLKGLLSEKEDSSFLLYLKREILRIDRCFDIELQIWLEEIIFQIPPVEAFSLVGLGERLIELDRYRRLSVTGVTKICKKFEKMQKNSKSKKMELNLASRVLKDAGFLKGNLDWLVGLLALRWEERRRDCARSESSSSPRDDEPKKTFSASPSQRVATLVFLIQRLKLVFPSPSSEQRVREVLRKGVATIPDSDCPAWERFRWEAPVVGDGSDTVAGTVSWHGGAEADWLESGKSAESIVVMVDLEDGTKERMSLKRFRENYNGFQHATRSARLRFRSEEGNISVDEDYCRFSEKNEMGSLGLNTSLLTCHGCSEKLFSALAEENCLSPVDLRSLHTTLLLSDIAVKTEATSPNLAREAPALKFSAADLDFLESQLSSSQKKKKMAPDQLEDQLDLLPPKAADPFVRFHDADEVKRETSKALLGRPKAWMAVERTLIQWLELSVLLFVVGGAALRAGLSLRDDVDRYGKAEAKLAKETDERANYWDVLRKVREERKEAGYGVARHPIVYGEGNNVGGESSNFVNTTLLETDPFKWLLSDISSEKNETFLRSPEKDQEVPPIPPLSKTVTSVVSSHLERKLLHEVRIADNAAFLGLGMIVISFATILQALWVFMQRLDSLEKGDGKRFPWCGRSGPMLYGLGVILLLGSNWVVAD